MPAAAQSYAIIRLHDAWARFCRELVLLSAQGKVITATGNYVPRSPVVAQRQSPLDALKSTYSSRRQSWVLWEPKWFDPSETVDAAARLKIANFATVSGGIAATSVAINDIRACRNFLAYRNKQSNDGLDYLRHRLGVSLSTRAEELANALVPGGASLFELWCWELLQRATNAVQ